MAFGRKVELVVQASETESLLISDLDIEFEVERSLTLSENTAKFIIYNAKEDTRNKILIKGNDLIFKVGYEDESIATIYGGSIFKATTIKDGADYKTEILCTNRQRSGQAYKTLTISASYSKGTLVSKIIQELASILGLVVNGLENASFPLQNGGVFVGSVNNALRYLKDILASQDLSVWIDKDEMVIYRIGETNRFSVVYLTFAGGLISIKDVTEVPKPEEIKKKKKSKKSYKNASRKRLQFESLIIPQAQVNSPMTFDTTREKGTYIVEKLTYKGNNFGGDFNMIGVVGE